MRSTASLAIAASSSCLLIRNQRLLTSYNLEEKEDRGGKLVNYSTFKIVIKKWNFVINTKLGIRRKNNFVFWK